MSIKSFWLAVCMALFAPMVLAQDAIADITGAVDFGTVITGVGAVGLALAGVYIAMKGARLILGFLRR